MSMTDANRPAQRLLGVGAVLAGLGVILGAFAAHALESRLSPGLLETFDTGARYHQLQSLAVVALAIAWMHRPRKHFLAAGWLITGGIVVFSGSLYLLALTGVGVLGAITPVGGLLMIGGWITAAVGAFGGGDG